MMNRRRRYVVHSVVGLYYNTLVEYPMRPLSVLPVSGLPDVLKSLPTR